MKATTDKLNVTLSPDELKAITTEVKETLAFDLKQQRSFTALDMWDIQRRRRTIGSRRNYA